MSRKSSSNKKRRLESEVSQTSGVSVFSSETQYTEVSNDSDDRKSDCSLGNQNTGLRGSNSNVLDCVQSQVNDHAHSQSQRKRQISWGLCGNEDETVLKYIPQAARTSPTRPSPAPYDNNINETFNRRRTRRATESCLETYGLSYIDPQSPICSPNDSQNMQKLRSNTTSELHMHENEIQRQRLMTQMIEEYDYAQRRQRVQRRSQSATSLQDHNLYATPSPEYDSVQQCTRTPAPTRPVETIVNIANSDPNYLHPITQVNRTHANNAGTTEHQIVNDWPQLSVGSGYAHVNGLNDHSNCFRNCNNSFYRKGFFVLLVLNVIFVLLNVVGLPFLYFAIEAPGIEDTPRVGAQQSDICIRCDGLDAMVRSTLAESGVYKSKDGECCASSVDKLLPTIMEATDVLAWQTVQENKADAKSAVVQLNASTDNTDATSNVLWESRPEMHNFNVQIIDDYMLQIPTTGYYYVFSRVHYHQKNFSPGTNEFMVGHSLIKQDVANRSIPYTIDNIVMRCFPDNSTGDVRHTNHLSSIQYLQEDDRLFIKLDYHKTFFDPTNTVFGLFLIAT